MTAAAAAPHAPLPASRPAPTRRERERTALQDRMLAAARELFAQSGYEAVTLRAVAQAIDYSPAAIYHHFADKDALIAALCAADYARLAEALAPATDAQAQAEADPWLRLQQFVGAYVRWGVAHPRAYEALMMRTLPAKALAAVTAATGPYDQSEPIYAEALACVRAVLASGRWHRQAARAELVVETLWAALHGIVSLEITYAAVEDDCAWQPLAERVGALLRLLDQGLGGPGEPIIETI